MNLTPGDTITVCAPHNLRGLSPEGERYHLVLAAGATGTGIVTRITRGRISVSFPTGRAGIRPEHIVAA